MEKQSSVTKSLKLKQLTTPVPPPPLPEKPDGGLVAKSPPETPPGGLSSTLQSRGSEDTHTGPEARRDLATVRVLTYGGLQLLSGVLMVVFGVLTLVHRAAMAGYGAGLWGGGCAAAAGLTGLLAGARGYYQPGEPPRPTPLTVYLALCLVSVAVTTLTLVLTSTGLLRDLQQPVVHTFTDDYNENVGAVLSSVGLLLLCVLLLVSLVTAVLRLYRLVCPCTRPPPPSHRLLVDTPHSHYTKQRLVHSWLGLGHQPPLLYPAHSGSPGQQPGLLVYPPPLLPLSLVDGSGLYTVPPSSVGYPPCITPLPGNPYMQRRRSPHPYRGHNSVTPDSAKRSRRQEKPKQKEVPKEKEITDEQLEKTYTGLDREIAEEFISIAMTNPEKSERGTPLRPSREDKVIECIVPM